MTAQQRAVKTWPPSKWFGDFMINGFTVLWSCVITVMVLRAFLVLVFYCWRFVFHYWSFVLFFAEKRTKNGLPNKCGLVLLNVREYVLYSFCPWVLRVYFRGRCIDFIFRCLMVLSTLGLTAILLVFCFCLGINSIRRVFCSWSLLLLRVSSLNLVLCVFAKIWLGPAFFWQGAPGLASVF